MIRTQSIQRKFTLAILALSLMLVILVSYLAHESAREIILSTTDKIHQTQVAGFSGELVNNLSQYQVMLTYMSSNPNLRAILKSHDYDRFRQRKSDSTWQQFRRGYMESMVRAFGGNVRLLYAGSERHGENYRHNDTSYAVYDARTRLWYQAAVKNQGFAFTSYLSHSRKTIDVTISYPIYENGRLLGVVGVDLATDRFIDQLAIQVTDSESVAMVVDSVGRLLYHPNPDFLLKNVTDSSISFSPGFVAAISKLTSQTGSAQQYESLSGDGHYLYSAPVGDMGWIAILDVNESAILQPTTDLLLNIVIIDCIILALIVFVAGFIVKRMIRVLDHVVSSMRNIAKGSTLRGQILEVNTKDEFGELAYWFNEFAIKYQRLFDQLEERGRQIASLAAQLNQSVAQLNSATVEQSSAVVETTSTVEEMYQSSASIAESATGVADSALTNQNLSKHGVELVRNFVRKIEEIERNNQHRTNDVLVMKKKVNRINEIMTLIRSINEQTKLIAFNAALEASGAGETGKRFAVVANEIRRLADTIQESMEEIRLMTDEIQSQTQQLMKGTDDNTTIINAGVASSRDVENQFMTIYNGTQSVVAASRQIEQATTQQKMANEQIVATLHDLSQAIAHVVAMAGEASQIVRDLEGISGEFTKGDVNV